MQKTLYSSSDSNPNEELVSMIKSFQGEYFLGLLVGMSGTPKNIFYQNLKANTLKESEKTTKSSNEVRKSIIQQSTKPCRLHKGAEIFIEESKNSNKRMWCNTDCIRNFGSIDDYTYIRNIAKYSSVIICFLEYNNENEIKDSIKFFSSLCETERNNEKIFCIKITSPDIKLHQSLNTDLKFELYKSYQYKVLPKTFTIGYENGELNTKSCLNELFKLQNSTLKSPLLLKPKDFFKTIEETAQNNSIKKQKIAESLILKTKEIENKEKIAAETRTNPDSINSTNFSHNCIEDSKSLIEDEQKNNSFSSFNTSNDTNPKFENSLNEEISKSYLSIIDTYTTVKSLDSWYRTKMLEFKNEEDMIEKVYNKKYQELDLEYKFKEFLLENKVKICNLRASNGSTIESTLNSIFEKFYKKKSSPSQALINIAKKFLYDEIDIMSNVSVLNFNLVIDELKKSVADMISCFKKDPYKYRIDEKFRDLKNQYSINIFKDQALADENFKKLNRRIDEFESTIRCIKKSAPALNLSLLYCFYCNAKGINDNSSRWGSRTKELKIDDIGKEEIENKIFSCINCQNSYIGSDLLNSSYDFQMNSSEKIVGIYMR